MSHFLLKFNYGVEIGAYLAYAGHYDATHDLNILHIMDDELTHRAELYRILRDHGEEPSNIINGFFTIVGKVIRRCCHYSPNFMLNFVASSMEIFAVVSYRKLSQLYPKYEMVLLSMAETEETHRQYFK